MIARAEAARDGVLRHDGGPLTSERVRAMANHWFIDQGYANPPSIIAGGRAGGDCHDLGHGPLRTGEPVIVDIFPRNGETLYYGDCTRTVVRGDVPDEVVRMHAAVCAAKSAGMAAAHAGVTGEDVHKATIAEIQAAADTRPACRPPIAPDSYCAMTHGTGHGVGPWNATSRRSWTSKARSCWKANSSPSNRASTAVTSAACAWRDIVLIHADRCETLNRLPEALDWR